MPARFTKDLSFSKPFQHSLDHVDGDPCRVSPSAHDQYHVYENFEASHPQGWLARDHDDWVRSHQMIKGLQKRSGGKLVFGHCKDTFDKYKHAPHAYQQKRSL
ncbi:hypothetical protein BKA81DRAFT_343419 [Phyllosticta paracitricarpa]